jgi:exopolyphosphatase / guanosine-5'-triphosphate,3'-diphosphate pyrophosphatase
LTAPAPESAGVKRASVSVGAAIDIGSNSVHLLVALVGPDFVEPLRDTSELLGLGDVVDERTEIPDETRHQLIEVLRTYAEMAHRTRAEGVALLGTEPLRRATNSESLRIEIAARTGLDLRVLTEEQEAILTFIGATNGDRPDVPLIVVDIGGGSTEVVVSIPGEPLQPMSVPLGSSRLTNSIVEHDPPTDSELDRLLLAAEEVIRHLPRPDTKLKAILVGGTATNIARLGRLTPDGLARDRRTLARMPAATVSLRFSVKPRRARQLAAGVAIAETLLKHFGLDEADVSEASLRDGAIIAAARLGDEWPQRLGELVEP